MLFSVIIPVYNVEQYLRECVDSVLNQSFTDFELVLVNDGSTDSSGAICDEYAEKDSRVKVIHKENGGSSEARNDGTKIATGDYVIYIDSDDYVSDMSFLECLKEKALNDYDIICYKFKKYFENTKEFSKCSFSIPELDNYELLSDRILYLVKQDAFYCSAWTKAIKRSLLLDNNIVFEKGLLGEDQEWYYHVLLKAKTISGIDEDFIVYRQRENSITSSFKMKNLKDCYYVVKKWYDGVLDANIDEDYKNALLHSIAKLYCNLLIGYTNLLSSEKKGYYKKIKEMSGILKYHLNPRTNLFYKIYRLVGFDFLMISLKIVCKIR